MAQTRRRRTNLRLAEYDYRQPGAYYVTICVLDQLHLLGAIIEEMMHESPAGQMVRAVWETIPEHYVGVGIDEFVVMPDHIHGVFTLSGEDGPLSLSLAQVVQRFKSLTTTRYRDGMASSGWPPYRGSLWQRNYYEHVIRDDAEWNRIRQYMRENVQRWVLRTGHPENLW